jgi:hypothetical protein
MFVLEAEKVESSSRNQIPTNEISFVNLEDREMSGISS